MGKCGRIYRDAVPEAAWEAVYTELAAAGRLGASFPGSARPDYNYFLDLLARPDRESWLLTFGRELAGVAYITDREGTSARIHFAFLPLKAVRCKDVAAPVALARYVTASLVRDTFRGEYILDTLIGLTPTWNKSAVKLILRAGGRPVGVIPGACPEKEGRNSPGLVTWYNRESTSPEWLLL